jgi:hypothetical protein
MIRADIQRTERRQTMKKLLIVASILLCAGLLGRWGVTAYIRSSHENTGLERVRTMLAGMTATGDLGQSIGMWIDGTTFATNRMSQDEWNASLTRFQGWLQKKRVASSIKAFEVYGATMEEEAEGPEGPPILVRFSVEGRDLAIRAVVGQPLEWAD